MADALKLLLEVTLIASAMTMAVLLVRRTLSRRMSPAVMLALWALVLLRLCVPFTLASPVSVAELWPRPAMTAPAPEAQAAPPGEAPERDIPMADAETVNAAADAREQAGTSAARPAVSPAVSDGAARQSIRGWLKAVPWESVLAGLWLTGAAATLGLHLRSARRFVRKLRCCRPVTDEGVLADVARHGQALGVKRAVAVLACDAVNAPTVFGYLRPRILIPPRFVRDMDRQSLGAILLHEMLHIRCHDLLASYVWLGAKTLHWFNPLVWLAYRQFGDDVEQCRDAQAVRRLDADGAYLYAQALVKAARFAKGSLPAPALAMPLFEKRSKVGERALRLAQPRRTKLAPVAAGALALLMLLAGFTTACQPTPEKPAVVGRQEDVLAAVQPVAPDEFETLEAPDHISETHDDFPYVSIRYDADVVVPEAAAYPVTEVKKRVFSEDDIRSYIELFAGGDGEMYFGWTLTKDDYLALLTKVKPYEGTERVTEETLERLQELYEKSTNDDVNRRINSLSDIPAEYPPFVNIKTADGLISHYSWQRDGNNFEYQRDSRVAAYAASFVADDLYYEKMDGPIEHYRWTQPGDPDISQEDAYAVALRYRDALGIDLDLYAAEPCSFIKDYVDKTTGWQFTFMRQISGLQTMGLAGTLGWREETKPSYGSPWGVEKLVVSVDKEGLFSLSWRGASAISRTVAESAQLKDFDAIRQRITDQLSYNYGFSEDASKTEIEISQIALGVSMIAMENRTDIGEYLPTWYVTYRYKGEGQGEKDWRTQHIMFNAIDGSYIEPRISVDELMGHMDVGGASEEG